MDTNRWQKRLMLFVLLSPVWLFSQTENWVYEIDGYGSANEVIQGSDGNIYAVGGTPGISEDFTVVSLTPSGTQKWIYKYNSPANRVDVGYSIVQGADGNIYTSGYSQDASDYYHLTVVSLDTSGQEQWVYQDSLYAGASVPLSKADIVYGADGNIYATGYRIGTGVIVSLNSIGDTNWVYEKTNTMFYSLVYGQDGNLYIAGFIAEPPSYQRDFMVLSVSTSGSERWLYKYDSFGNADVGKSLVFGSDGNIYSAGYTGSSSSRDFTVLSVDTSGTQRWVYAYGIWTEDGANSICYGADGNIYAGGGLGDPFAMEWTVISYTSQGDTNWIYTYDGPAGEDDWVNSITYGSDRNIYTTGWSESASWSPDFTIMSTDSSGIEKWVYRGPKGWGWSVIQGSDGNIYAGGEGYTSVSGKGFTVISLTPPVKVEEVDFASRIKELLLKIEPNPFYSSGKIRFYISDEMKVALRMHDIAGRAYPPLVNGIFKQGWNELSLVFGKNLPKGVYFLRLETPLGSVTKKIIRR